MGISTEVQGRYIGYLLAGVEEAQRPNTFNWPISLEESVNDTLFDFDYCGRSALEADALAHELHAQFPELRDFAVRLFAEGGEAKFKTRERPEKLNLMFQGAGISAFAIEDRDWSYSHLDGYGPDAILECTYVKVGLDSSQEQVENFLVRRGVEFWMA